jgi:hypothetical protein
VRTHEFRSPRPGTDEISKTPCHRIRRPVQRDRAAPGFSGYLKLVSSPSYHSALEPRPVLTLC